MKTLAFESVLNQHQGALFDYPAYAVIAYIVHVL